MRDRMRMAMRAGAVVALVGGSNSFAGDSSGPAFDGPLTYPLGTSVRAIEVLDLDGDGDRDVIAVGDDAPGRIWVLTNDGTGAFVLTATTETGITPSDLVVHDFNGDGTADVALTDRAADSIEVLTGVRDGTFVPSSSIPVGSAPANLRLADLDGDGLPDLLALNRDEATFSIVRNSGGGAFEFLQSIPVGAGPTDLRIAFINDDAVADCVVVCNSADTIEVHLGLGDATFAAPTSYGVGEEPAQVAIADVNSDGLDDVAVVCEEEESVHLFVGSPTGTLSEHAVLDDLSAYDRISFFDDDLDGALEIIVRDSRWVNYQVIEIEAASLVSARNGRVGRYASQLRRVDVDGEGGADLVAISEFDGDVLVVRGGSERAPAQFPSLGDAATNVYGAAIADLNGDGWADVVVPQFFRYQVLMGQPDGSYLSMGIVQTGQLWNEVELVDLDGDGFHDLVGTIRTLAVSVVIMRGRGDGTFDEPVTYRSVQQAIGHVVSDVNRDGVLDVVVAHDFARNVGVMIGFGDGTFSAMSIAASLEGTPTEMACADLDGDGEVELLILTTEPNELVRLAEWSAPGFGAIETVALPHVPSDLEVTDANHDGSPDLLIGSRDEPIALRLRNDGLGGLTPEEVTLAAGQHRLVSADITGDRVGDLLVWSDAAITVWEGLPSGGYAARESYPGVDNSRHQLGLFDMNQDGAQDMVVVDSAGFRVGLARESHRRTCAADLDSSGDVDFDDVLLVLAGWGTAAGDVTGDGDTTFNDLIAVIAAWGECP